MYPKDDSRKVLVFIVLAVVPAARRWRGERSSCSINLEAAAAWGEQPPVRYLVRSAASVTRQGRWLLNIILYHERPDITGRSLKKIHCVYVCAARAPNKLFRIDDTGKIIVFADDDDEETVPLLYWACFTIEILFVMAWAILLDIEQRQNWKNT